jgi:hypothetical protein
VESSEPGNDTAVQLDEHTWEVRGQKVTLPVEVRAATMASAMFLVRRAGVASLLPAGLEPVTVAGRALLALVFVDYHDGDLGAYHEVGTCFIARRPGGRAGAYIHRLPVDGEFTMAAGRGLWGFPKWLTTSELTFEGATATCHLRDGDEHVLTMAVRGLPVALPGTREVTMDAWTWADGQLRRTPWTMRLGATRPRPGGTTVVLGTSHPMAVELRRLGLPKRAAFSTITGRVQARFDAAELVTP